MPTDKQLQQERWWTAEYLPPSVARLVADVRAAFGLAASAVGAKGDRYHLRGYHRSRAWIRNSTYCTNRTYSVSETPGNRAGGDDNWICAIDITIDNARLLPMCRRLDAAVRAGRLEKVTEWYGNTDGDSRVDGYNNIANRVASSDSSHLWHLHISLDRGRAGEDHSDLLAVLTGQTTMGVMLMFCAKGDRGPAVQGLQALLYNLDHDIKVDGVYGPQTVAALAAVLDNPKENGDTYGPWQYAAVARVYAARFAPVAEIPPHTHPVQVTAHTGTAVQAGGKVAQLRGQAKA